MEQWKLSYIAGGNAKWYNTFGKCLLLSYKIKHIHLLHFSNHTPQYFPKGVENYVYTETYTQMFIAPVVIIAKNFKQSRCLSVGEWISKL